MILQNGQYSTSAYRQRAALESRTPASVTTTTNSTPALSQSLGQTLSNVASATVNISEAALAGLEGAGKLLVTGVEDAAMGAVHGIEGTYEAAKTGLVDLADGVVSGAEGAWHLIEGGVTSTVNELDSLAASAASVTGKVASDVNSISSGASNVSSQVATAARNIAAIRGSAGIQALSTIV